MCLFFLESLIKSVSKKFSKPQLIIYKRHSIWRWYLNSNICRWYSDPCCWTRCGKCNRTNIECTKSCINWALKYGIWLISLSKSNHINFNYKKIPLTPMKKAHTTEEKGTKHQIEETVLVAGKYLCVKYSEQNSDL